MLMRFWSASAPTRFRRRMADRKSTRLNSSHLVISYAVFCLKKKKKVPAKRNLYDVTCGRYQEYRATHLELQSHRAHFDATTMSKEPQHEFRQISNAASLDLV